MKLPVRLPSFLALLLLSFALNLPGHGALTLDQQAAPSRHRKVALNGRQIGDEKPQAKSESDAIFEGSYVDTFDCSLQHTATDIHIPIPHSDLALEVRRSVAPEYWFEHNGVRPAEMPDRPFGSGWTSNLAAGIHFVRHALRFPIVYDPNGFEPDYAYVTDTNGDVTRFLILTENGGEKFVPLPNAKNQQESYLATLSGSGSTFYFTKKYGTLITFTMTTVEYVLRSDRAFQSGRWDDQHSYARVYSVKDRNDNQLNYSYDRWNTVIPSAITVAAGGQTLNIYQDTHGQVTRVTDPRGQSFLYEYTEEATPEVNYYGDPVGPGTITDRGQVGAVPVQTLNAAIPYTTLHKVTAPKTAAGTAVTTYRYNLTTRSRLFPDAYYTASYSCQLAGITNPKGDNWDFFYGEDLTHLQYILGYGYIYEAGHPEMLSQVNLPGGLGTAYFNNVSSVGPLPNADYTALEYHGHKATVVVDSEGYARVYHFTGNAIYPLSGFNPYFPNLYSFAPLRVPHISYYQGLEITSCTSGEVAVYDNLSEGDLDAFSFYPSGSYGTETYHFNLDAGLSVDGATDLSGNHTAWSYDDGWNYQSNYPPLVGGNFAFGSYADPTRQTNSLGKVKTFAYSGPYRILTRIVDESGRSTNYTLDSHGNRTSEILADPISGTSQQTTFTYGANGFPTSKNRLKLSGDPSWAKTLTTTYTATPKNYVASEKVVVGPDNLITRFTYDNNGNKIRVVDPKGNVTRMVYDALNHLTQIDYPPTAGINGAPVAARKKFSYDLVGQLIREIDENGIVLDHTYDALGRMTSTRRHFPISANDQIQSSAYNSVGSKTFQTDAAGQAEYFFYDGLQRLTLQMDATGATTQYFYDGPNAGGSIFDSSSFHPTRVVNRRGVVTDFAYDSLYRQTASSTAYAGNQSATTTYTHDDVGRQTAATDALGNTTRQTYDVADHPLKTTYADASSQVQKYSTAGILIQTKDELGTVTDYQYDSAGRTISMTSPPVLNGVSQATARPVTRSFYDLNSNVIGIVDARGNRTDFGFDERNRKMLSLLPAVQDADLPTGSAAVRPQTDYYYDPAGNLLTTVDARSHRTDFQYDAANRLVKTTAPAITLPDGSSHRPVTQTIYDKAGNAIYQIDANGHGTANAYDSLNRLVHTHVDGTNTPSDFAYDEEGNRTAVIEGNQNRTEFTYDGLNRNTGIRDADGRWQTFTYNGVNKISRVQAGQTTRYSHDKRNHLKTVTYAGRSQDNQVYTRDKKGRILAVGSSGNPIASVAYAYDALDRILGETSAGITTHYRYDLAGNKVWSNTPVGGQNFPLSNAYDAANRIISTVDADNRATHFSYDLTSNLRHTAQANGDRLDSLVDALNRVVEKTVTSGASANGTAFSVAYHYDAVGNVAEIQETYAAGLLPARTIANSYDAANRLVHEQISTPASGLGGGFDLVNKGHAYDGTGNRVSLQENTLPAAGGGVSTHTTFRYNILNQLTFFQRGGEPIIRYTYDAKGNRITQKKQGQVTPDRFAYDYENRLVVVSKTGLGTFAYDYDYRSRRVRRAEPGGTTRLAFSGGLSAAEFADDGTGAAQARFIRGPDQGGGVSGLLYSVRDGVASHAYESARGDVVLRTDGNGVMTWLGSYNSFGQTTSQWGSTAERHKANTKEEDPTGLLNEGMRYRDLETGVFLTRDPAGFIDGPNLYTYVRQNPWSSFDPLGLLTESERQGYHQSDAASTAVINQYGASDDQATTPAEIQSSKLTTSYLGLSNPGFSLTGLLGKEINPSNKAQLRSAYNWWESDSDVALMESARQNKVHANFLLMQHGELDRESQQRIQLRLYLGMLDLTTQAAFIPFSLARAPAELYEGAVGVGAREFGAARGGGAGTEVVQRWMSQAELQATQSSGLLRGGRDGVHYVTDAANTAAQRARLRLALPQTPQVRVTLEVPGGTFSAPSRVQPAFNMPGGGMERTATGQIPVKILGVD